MLKSIGITSTDGLRAVLLDFIDYINMKKMGEAEVFQKRGINFLRVRVRMPDHMKELNRVAGGFGFFAGDVVKEETLDEMSAKDHWRKFKSKGVVAAIDKDKYPNREKEGLEGPYRTKKGLVYYYDRKEGKYYDPDTDMYLDVKDVMEETELNENKFREVLNKGKKLGDWNMLSYFLYDGNVWMLQSGRAVNQGKLEDFKKKAQKGLLKSIGLDEETLDEAAGDVELTYPNADAAKVFASTMTRKGVKGIVVKGKKVIFNITDFNKASSIKEPLSHFIDKAKREGLTDLRGTKDDAITELLNWGIEHEYTVILQYLVHSYMAKNAEVKKEMQDQAINEMQHLGWLAEEMVSGNGNPRIEYGNIEKPPALEDMLKADIRIEKQVAEEYGRAAKAISDDGLRKLLKRISGHEKYHAEVLEELLKKEK